MKEYKSIHGFDFIKATVCPEQSGVFVEYRHGATGAPLFYFDRPDENMTFAIGFRTVPTDDTGVFHILEHSVLCGSKKYPVKDPFSELLKGSVSTFLNAFTYGDRTVYPVSSLNKKAFLDLVSVYLDAVLHPLALENENIFLQEGHRLELTEDGRLVRNGIVYNEMRGAYSSPDELAAYYEGRLVFDGGCYGYDSGGRPDAIPSLTYAQFKRAHEKYYHPSNSILYLDGGVDLEAVLALIDSYLGEYGMGECFEEIGEGVGINKEPLTVEYPVATADEEKDATRIVLLRRFSSHGDKAKFHAAVMAAEAVSDGNSSPFKKAILDSGMCKNFSFYPISGMKYPTFVTRFTDVKDGCCDELIALYRKTLAEILEGGIDSEVMSAVLNNSEFQTREMDFGTYPRGMVFMSAVMEDTVCADDPTETLKYNELFTFLRSKLDTPYYIDTLREIFDGDDEACLILRPSATLEERNAAKEEEEMARLLASMSEDEIEEIRRKNASLAIWQGTPDTDEDIATIPLLSIDDLGQEARKTPTDIYYPDGVRVISHPIATNGITYLNLYFDISDLDNYGMAAAATMSLTTSDFDTERRTASDFRNHVKANIGGIGMAVRPFKNSKDTRLYLLVSLSTLEKNKETAIQILKEFIYEKRYDDKPTLKRRLNQIITYAKEALPQSAPGSCIGLGAAAFDKLEAVKEITGGISYFLSLKEWERENREGELLAAFNRISEEYLTRSRLTVSVTGEYDADFIKAVTETIKEGGSTAGECKTELMPREDAGIAIASSVSFATVVTNFVTEADGDYRGSLLTLGTLLDYELYWNEIRVKGGAYGTSFICRGNSGTLSAYSYRDPSPEISTGVFLDTAGVIRSFLSQTPDLTRYIIGTVGALESVATPRTEGMLATTQYLSDKTFEDTLRLREEAIRTTHADLERDADMIERAMKSAVRVVAGPREKLTAMGFDKIIEL